MIQRLAAGLDTVALADTSGEGTVGVVGDGLLTGGMLSRLLQPAIVARAMTSQVA